MIKLQLPRPRRRRPWIYGIAGHRLSSNAPLPILEAFWTRDHRIQRNPLRRSPVRCRGSVPAIATQHVFGGPVELGPERFLLDCSWHEVNKASASKSTAVCQLQISDLGRFVIERNGQQIVFEPGPDSRGPTRFSTIFLGPPLTLALAIHGIWCLHASAVEIGGGTLAFLGASGVGKSTLARSLPALSNGHFRRVADDVLPIDIEAGHARALPRFPQLKHRFDQQPGASAPSSLPLTGIYLLETEDAGKTGVTIEPLTGHAALLALIRHTHTARLFSRELLKRHTDACARLIRHVPIRRLVYPREWQSLPRVEKALRLEASSGASFALARFAKSSI